VFGRVGRIDYLAGLTRRYRPVVAVDDFEFHIRGFRSDAAEPSITRAVVRRDRRRCDTVPFENSDVEAILEVPKHLVVGRKSEAVADSQLRRCVGDVRGGVLILEDREHPAEIEKHRGVVFRDLIPESRRIELFFEDENGVSEQRAHHTDLERETAVQRESREYPIVRRELEEVLRRLPSGVDVRIVG